MVYLSIIFLFFVLSAVTFSRAGIWRNSVTLWSDAAEKVPDCARIWGNLGNAYAAVANRGDALNAFKRGLDLDPNDIQTLYDSGTMYLNLGDIDQAHSLLKKLLTLVPNHVIGLVSYGDCCLLLGDYVEAEKSYLRSHQLQPDAVEPLVKLGNSAVLMNRLDDARRYYLDAEKISGDNPEIAYNMACVESLSGYVDSALSWLDKALQRGYRDAHTLHTNQELANARADARFERILARYFIEKK
jgi:tetratricopeptide (TPR) repeat protein